MKYIGIRVILLLLLLVVIYYVSDYIQEHTVVDDGDYNFEGVIAFFQMTLALSIISVGLFIYEACQFHKRKENKKRNASLILISLILIVLILFAGYFFQFVY
ncbi:hypothetical protein HMPREF0765_4183 [Sphingobacterium spiritivorum ATCC 33300]|uniref:Uncharacterized protein n=1 Tax=Sphingobacterium spiritivorum ATCC 33300 TaxID=525372 RepID=C2G3M7_SPHSI|nr:hypothetical protein [Sphingobacterium spiritivorum]EEI90232.1 hypothetical protein HMPREF0765_4183 [Sphingobacterium spiritivorum ATCC 33300]QQS95136.1 hypothetical protein I6J03_17400 [Sphingobacterium spiritivorum]